MGIASSTPNKVTRAGVGEAAPPDNIYVGWYRRFLLLFGALSLVITVGVWLDPAPSIQQRLVVSVTVIAMVLWFWFFGQWHFITSDAHAIAYLLGNIVGITVCIRIWESSSLLLFAMYWFGFAYLYTRYALVYAFLLTIATQWAFGTLGSDIGLNLDTLVAAGLLILLLGFSAMMARYIEAFQIEAERNKALVAELQLAQQSLVEQEREAGIEQERRRMAGEIHDTIAQHFTSIITNLRAADELQDRDSAVSRHHVANAFSSAQQGLADSRSMLSTMQPDVLLGRSLSDVLGALIDDWSNVSDCTASFVMEGVPAHLTRSQEFVMVRALQEALRNTNKHAGASHVQVTLSWLEDEVLMDITDDGRGFYPDSIVSGTNGYQMGLVTLESRVESAGGTFALESQPGEGTSVTISFPTGGEQE